MPFAARYISIVILIVATSCNNKSIQENSTDAETSSNIEDIGLLDQAVANSHPTENESSGDEDETLFNSIAEIGIGVVQIDEYIQEQDKEPVYFDSIFLYNDPECTDLYLGYKINETQPFDQNLEPVLKAELFFGFFNFVCIQEESDSYKIYINQKDIKYLKKQPNIRFESWEQFFSRIFLIVDTKRNPYRTEPNDNAPIIEIPELDGDIDEIIEANNGRRTQLKDEWLHLYYPKIDKDVWIRWRVGNQIIIKVYIGV